jgi:hypothetical protein
VLPQVTVGLTATHPPSPARSPSQKQDAGLSQQPSSAIEEETATDELTQQWVQNIQESETADAHMVIGSHL